MSELKNFGVLNTIYNWEHKGDLLVDRRRGYAMSLVPQNPDIYNQQYFDKYVNYSQTELGLNLTKARVDLCKKYHSTVIDFGIGSGQFMEAYTGAIYGYDINMVAVNMLKSKGIYFDLYTQPWPHNLTGITFWDALEHVEDPSALLKLLPRRVKVFISIPIVRDWTNILTWKHYRPGEHGHYWSSSGLIKYMRQLGYKLYECTTRESELGRSDIGTFVFG